MIIIDFNGLPGCGKSTYAIKLHEELTSQNMRCEFFNNNEYEKDKKVHRNKLKFYFRLLIPKNFFNLINSLVILKNKKIFKRELKLKEKIWKLLRIVILNDRIHYNVKKNNKDILIIDQGIIQDFVDFILDKDIKEDIFLMYKEGYIDLKEKIIFVNAKSEKKVAIKRIKKRNRKKYDVDQMAIDELDKFLEIYNTNLENIRQVFKDDFINVDINVNQEKYFNENIEKIVKVIKESSEKQW